MLAAMGADRTERQSDSRPCKLHVFTRYENSSHIILVDVLLVQQFKDSLLKKWREQIVEIEMEFTLESPRPEIRQWRVSLPHVMSGSLRDTLCS